MQIKTLLTNAHRTNAHLVSKKTIQLYDQQNITELKNIKSYK